MTHWPEKILRSYRAALIIYSIIFVAVAFPFIFSGEVVSPYKECGEFGLADTCRDASRLEHRGLTDHPSFYVPEVYQHLQGERSGWISLWTEKNELGRPLAHLSGFSSAYLPSWLLSKFTKDPWVFITIFSLVTSYLAGVFLLLFAREEKLDPIAGVVGAIALGLSPNMMFWLIFPMYGSAWCWSACTLWGLTRTINRRDSIGWLALAFSVYSLIFTAYPQYIAFHVWILLGYGIFAAHKKRIILKPHLCFLCLSAAAIGAILALPMLLDLQHVVQESFQHSKSTNFFTMYLQGMNYWIDAVRFGVFVTQPELFGNYASNSYKFPSYGFSVNLGLVFLSVVALFGNPQRSAYWGGVTSLFVYLTFSYSFYEFGIKYLGFNLNPILPIAITTLPLSILALYGADAVLERRSLHRTFIVGAGIVGLITVLATALYYSSTFELKVRPERLLFSLVIISLFVVQFFNPRPFLLIFTLALTIFGTSYPVMFRQNIQGITNTSPLVEAMQSYMSNGGRYLIANPGYGLALLPPNINARIGIATVHNSNSLASKRYQIFLESMNEPTDWKGGRNSSLSPDYNSDAFWMSNVSLVLSPNDIVHGNLEFVEEIGGVRLYKVLSRMGDALQVPIRNADINSNDVIISEPRRGSFSAHIDFNKGDVVSVDLGKGEQAVLVLSQKYHRDWEATAFGEFGTKPISTGVINRVYQGALVPAGTERVVFEFRPYVRFAWVAHLIWAILFFGVSIIYARRRNDRIEE